MMKHLGLLLIPVLVVGMATSGLAAPPTHPGGGGGSVGIPGNYAGWTNTGIKISPNSMIIIRAGGTVAFNTSDVKTSAGPITWYQPGWGGFCDGNGKPNGCSNPELLDPSLEGWELIGGIGGEPPEKSYGMYETFYVGRFCRHDYYGPKGGKQVNEDPYLWLAANDSLYGNDKNGAGYADNRSSWVAWIRVVPFIPIDPTGPTGPTGPSKMGEFLRERVDLSPTTITYEVERSGHVKIEIYDAANDELVRVLEDSDMNAGEYEVIFDGKDNTGAPLPAGPYFCRIDLNGERRFQKVIFLL